MLVRIFRKSLQKRRGRIILAIIAVIMGASIPSAMLTVSVDMNSKIGAEFRKFGANLLIVPKSDTISIGLGDISLSSVTDQRYISEIDVYKVKDINWSENILGYAPFLYQVVNAKTEQDLEQQVVLTGTWFEKNTTLDEGTSFITGVRKINSWWWEIEGNWIQDQENITGSSANCMIGKTVAEKLNLDLGDSLNISYENTTAIPLNVSAILTTGGSEDNQIFVPLALAQSLTDRSNDVHTIQVSALCIGCPIETIASEIESELLYVEAKTILQMTNAEMSVLGKLELMMTLVTFLALAATILGVSTTLTTSVLERTSEIGLMKSIGAENKIIILLFLAEAALIGVVGGILGYLPITVGISCLVALIASIMPVRSAIRIEPIVVLRRGN
ncbi:MAG: ABC transporter permease [Candidatus Hodarchaeales archaeon]|jgi:putative ABC transport system permease protein